MIRQTQENIQQTLNMSLEEAETLRGTTQNIVKIHNIELKQMIKYRLNIKK